MANLIYLWNADNFVRILWYADNFAGMNDGKLTNELDLQFPQILIPLHYNYNCDYDFVYQPNTTQLFEVIFKFSNFF